jgi:nickel transport protein
MRSTALVFAFLCGPALAHEVHVETAHQSAAVLRLTYADGEPFAFEAYELYLPGKEVPEQVGRTNAQGQIIFLPGQQSAWRVKAFSADGHGIDQRMEFTPTPAEGAGPPVPSAQPPRAWQLATGLGILFGLFGLVQLFSRRTRSS